jgi:ketosteroid isomerase-like protein
MYKHPYIMKKLALILLTGMLIWACEESTSRYVSASPEIDVVKALVKDYEDGDWQAWESHYADTAKVYHNTTEPSSVAEVRDGLGGLLANVSAYGFRNEDMFHEMIIDDDGEKWVNFWGNWEGTLSETGETMIIPVHLTLQFEDGKIVEEHAYYNLAGYMAAMNAIESARMPDEDGAGSE